MTDTIELKKDPETESGDEVYSKAVRAGKRTYFFDVKATRGDDYYLTLTESRKKEHRDGGFYYEKHKIHLYKEDFSKFADGLHEVIEFIKTNKPEFFTGNQHEGEHSSIDEEFDRL